MLACVMCLCSCYINGIKNVVQLTCELQAQLPPKYNSMQQIKYE